MEEIKNIEAEKPFAFEVEGAPHIAVPETTAFSLLKKSFRNRFVIAVEFRLWMWTVSRTTFRSTKRSEQPSM